MDILFETKCVEDTLPFQNDVISALNECQTKEARRLCIFELAHRCNGQKYHIGGTYKDSKPELNFYCTLNKELFNCFILNIFACHQSEGTFTIGISASNKFGVVDPNGKQNNFYVFLPKKLKYRTFHSIIPDESHHILSVCFTKHDMDIISDKGICIPIEIDMTPRPVDVEVVQRLKANHDFSSLLKKEKNYTLISTSGKRYETNKLVLAAHSQVLREKIKNTELNTMELDIDDVKMDLLLEYLYTGSIENTSLQNYNQIFEIADQFKLENLKLIQYAISDQIRIENAIDIFALSHKYKLRNLHSKVFTFIKKNPAVLETEAWKNFKDLTITKNILKGMSK